MKFTRKIFIRLFVLFVGVTSFTYPTSIILINGTTCSGKSTTARTLATMLYLQGKRVVHLSIDNHIMKTVGTSRDRYLRHRSPFTDDLSLLADTFNQEIEALAQDQENDFIIVEHCFLYEEMFCCTLLRLRRFDVFFVKIHCTYQAALNRLRLRNAGHESEHRLTTSVDLHFGRIKEAKTKTFIDFHANKIYDMEIDSTSTPPDERACRIMALLNVEPMAFKQNWFSNHWLLKIEAFYPHKVITEFLSSAEEVDARYDCF